MGFTLGITNAPAGAVLWNANFAERTFDYEPLADSGWLGIGEVWEYPSNPLGCTTLRIWALDADNNILFDVYNLGPVNDGKDYTYDCSTGILGEVAEVVPCEITIDAPDSAREGETVEVSVKVTNTAAVSYLFRVKLYAVRDIYAVPTSEETIGSLEVVIGGGQSQVVSGTFTMPAWDTIVLVMVHRFVDYWDYDNHATKVVSLGAPVPEYKGSIARKELEYDETRGNIPVY